MSSLKSVSPSEEVNRASSISSEFPSSAVPDVSENGCDRGDAWGLSCIGSGDIAICKSQMVVTRLVKVIPYLYCLCSRKRSGTVDETK